VPYNGSISDMKKDNSINLNPAVPFKYKTCEVPKDLLERHGKTVKVVYKNRPIKGALVKVYNNPCVYKTDSQGKAKIIVNCIGCPIYAFKEGYISSVVYNDIRKSYILNLYKTLTLHVWTIYTPDWIINHWGNNTFKNLKFQGVDGNQFSNNQPISLIKLNTSANVPKQFKEIPLPLRLNLRVSLIYSNALNMSNLTYMTNGGDVLADIPYKLYYSNGTNFIYTSQIVTFDAKNKDWYYDDKNHKLIVCTKKGYLYRGPEINIGKDVILIKLSNNKVIEFPYYNGIFNIENQKTSLSTKYLVICLPRGVSINNQVYLYSYDPRDKVWKKKRILSFSSIFKPLN